MLKRIVFAASLLGVLVAAGAAVASSGAGSGKSASWISEPRVVSSSSSSLAAATSGPRYGDVVTFDVSTTQTSNPFVNVRCSQNGTQVYDAWSAFFAGGLGDETFGLASAAWRGGGANCTANLDKYANGKWKVLASTSFHVDG
jgi:hypothetical protein